LRGVGNGGAATDAAALDEQRRALAEDIRRAGRVLDRYYAAFETGDLDLKRFQTRVSALESRLADLIRLHRVIADDGWVSQESIPTATGELVVRVQDVDAHCERARVAGAEMEHVPQDQPYGVREYSARDLEGRRWAFVTPLG
jgi:uncharacterized glyoxalase superfamily protein PhnB